MSRHTACLLLLAAAVGLWWWQSGRAAGDAPTYTTQAAARGNLTLLITANGTIQPTRSINIGSELSGTVLEVKVDVNDQVQKVSDTLSGWQATRDFVLQHWMAGMLLIGAGLLIWWAVENHGAAKLIKRIRVKDHRTAANMNR